MLGELKHKGPKGDARRSLLSHRHVELVPRREVAVILVRGIVAVGAGLEGDARARSTRGFFLLITEFIKEVSPLLPNPCHYQTMIGMFIPRSVCLRRMPPED